MLCVNCIDSIIEKIQNLQKYGHLYMVANIFGGKTYVVNFYGNALHLSIGLSIAWQDAFFRVLALGRVWARKWWEYIR